MTIFGLKPGSFVFLIFLLGLMVYSTEAAFDTILKTGPVWPALIAVGVILLIMAASYLLSRAREQKEKVDQKIEKIYE